MLPAAYQHAVDSGVYLKGVDTSRVDSRQIVNLTVSDRKPTTLLAIGQSNIANHGAVQFACSHHVFNFNPFDGQFYHAADPLLGATGDGGSPLCILADSLIESGFAESIVLCSIAVGGAAVAEWAPGGPYHNRLNYALVRLKAVGLWPSHVLWHQGEADALYGTSAENYVRDFRRLAHSLRSMAITGPILVARASYFAIPKGYDVQQREIRSAQESLMSSEELILPGPDTDLIGDRYDGCHFGSVGLRKHAWGWHYALRESAEGQSSTLRKLR
jgi:Carbohydrate esterase, sialic acid-specific acetylesterase